MSRLYKVIVVEDEAMIRENIVKKIREAHPGFIVTAQAHNGQAALERIREDPPDLLVTDIRMAVMDGLELAETVYYRHPDIRMIIISGYNEFEFARQAMRFGVSEFLLKPLDAAELRNALSRLYERFSEEDAGISADMPALPEIEARGQIAESAAEYLRTNYLKHPSLESVADRFRITPAYLGRAFKDQFGVSPGKYVFDLIMNQAKKILDERPELMVKEIASMLGYDDQCYFSRAFRKLTGMSPVDYRERAGKVRNISPEEDAGCD